MKNHTHTLGRALSLLMAAALTLSLCTVPAFAAGEQTAAGSLVNTAGDGGANAISLSGPRTFKASVPVDMTEAEAVAAAGTVTWSLLPDGSKTYLDAALYPNQTKGGSLEGWVCDDGETPLFTDVTTAAETVDGQVCLTVTFRSACYFGDDLSVPHRNGGSYMDVCGYFNLTALRDGKALGAAPLKIAPYDDFHTMAEIYAEIDAMEAYAAEHTDLYVERCSMGKSAGDNGLAALDMPYLIVAKSRAAVDKWRSIKEQAESDPAALIKKLQSGALGDYQVPVLYSNVHANEVAASDGIVKFGWMLLEAAAGDGKIDYDKLTGFTAAGEAELQAQMGKAGADGSVAVPDLVKDTASYLGYLKGEGLSVSGPVDQEQYYTVETETVDVDELLSDVFFLLVPEENVEGRTYLTRTSSGGFDLNRDNSFQTQAETQNMTAFIAAWNPVSFTEFHGRVQTFQCEPCDPPHEPNFEYDLLARHLMTGGEALGIAAVANNDGYNSYVIPQRDYLTYTGKTVKGEAQTQWLDPWDDMSTSYTPQYAMLHGTVSYTVEVPAYNDHVAQAVAYGQLGQSAYIAENKDSYLLTQAQIFERGVTNANSDAYDLVGQWFCDQYDVEGAEAELFRPEYDGPGQNGNFYPECYIIPLDGANQHNLQAADEMLTYLSRNDVQLMTAKRAFTYGGVKYPAGTAVVSMYQAKRSVANGVLYDGTVITGWPVLYSEGITAFNKTRGFDMAVCAEPAAYKTIAAACAAADQWSVASSFTGEKDAQVILVNASEASTAAVNALLKAGKTVSLITEGDYKGSFLVSYADFQSVSGDYLVTGVGVAQAPAAKRLTRAPVVYICGKPADAASGFVKAPLTSGAYEYNYDRQAVELLGFTVTGAPEFADLIIGAAAPDEAAMDAIRSGTPYLGYGRRAIPAAAALFPEGALIRETAGENAMDALAYITYPTESLITASYAVEGDDLLYGYGAGYFAAVPEGAQVLVKLDGSKGLLEGFLPSTGAHYKDFLNDSVQAIAYQGEGANGAALNVVLFANTLTNKVHQRDEFNYIANAAFAAVLAGTGYRDVAADAWYADAVAGVTSAGLMNGTSASTFSPTDTTSRAMLTAILYRAAGSPEAGSVPFTDVAADAWYAPAAAWAAANGVTRNTEGTFAPDAPLPREEAAYMLWQFAKLQGLDVAGQTGMAVREFSDYDAISGWAGEAMAWAVNAGVFTGNDANALTPQGTATRAELAALILRTVGLFTAAA